MPSSELATRRWPPEHHSTVKFFARRQEMSVPVATLGPSSYVHWTRRLPPDVPTRMPSTSAIALSGMSAAHCPAGLGAEHCEPEHGWLSPPAGPTELHAWRRCQRIAVPDDRGGSFDRDGPCRTAAVEEFLSREPGGISCRRPDDGLAARRGGLTLHPRRGAGGRAGQAAPLQDRQSPPWARLTSRTCGSRACAFPSAH